MQQAAQGRYRLTAVYFSAASKPARAVPWQITLRVKGGSIQRFSGVLHTENQEEKVSSFDVR